MINSRYIVSLCIVFLVLGCSDKKNNNLQDITPIVIDWSNISKEMDYSSWVEDSVLVVPLETRDDCLIGEISKLVYQNHRIYIADRLSKAVYVFDESGQLHSKVRAVGNGPGEYLDVSAFTVQDDRIFIFDKMNRKVFVYNDGGQFLYTKDASQIWAGDMFFRGNDLYLFNSSGRTRMGCYSFFKLNPVEGKDKAEASFPFEYQETAGWGIKRDISMTEDEVLFTMWPYDILYLMKDGSFQPIYKVDFGKRRLPEQYIKADGETALITATRDNYITGIEWVGLSTPYIFLSFQDADDETFIIQNRENEKTFVVHKLYNHYLGDLAMTPINTYLQDEYIIQVRSMDSWVMEYQYGHLNYDEREFHSEHTRSLFKKFQQMDEDSNPVVIIQKFKE